MQLLGSAETIEEKIAIFFKHIDKNPNLFTIEKQMAVVSTFLKLIEMDDIGEPPELIKTKDGKRYLIKELLKMPFKFFIELLNVELTDDLKYFHAIPALFYRKDWTKPYSDEEYLESQQLFHKEQFRYTLWAMKVFDNLIVTLKENYPILYKGGSNIEESGRRMYSVLRRISNGDITKMEDVEKLKLWRVMSWLEQEEIEYINQKNKS